jgi:hypothetical protein
MDVTPGGLSCTSERYQQQSIAYLIEANRVLKAQLGGRGVRLADTERRRLVKLAHPLGYKHLKDFATIEKQLG